MKSFVLWGRRVALVLIGIGLGGYSLGMGIYAVASTQPRVASQPTSPAEAEAVLESLGLSEAYPFEHGFIRTGRGRMHYAQSGQGAPMLLLHGNPTWSFMYRHLLRGLADSQRLVAPDLIGFGLSEKLASPDAYTLAGHIDDVVALIEALDLRGITLVMQDWGGPIGLGVWLRVPDRIRALVVMNTYGFDADLRSGGAGAGLALRAVRAPLMGEQLVQGLGVPQRLLLQTSLEKPENSSAVLDAYLAVQGSWPERAGALAFPRWLPAREGDPAPELLRRAREALSRRPLPALIVWGMRDPLLGRDALAQWQATLPNAKLVELEEVGHLPPEEAPEAVRDALRAFVSSLGDPVVPIRQAEISPMNPNVGAALDRSN